MSAPMMRQRRGACPGLSAPMLTGDGLLVRLLPTGTIPLAAFADLCRAARTYGNGVVEVTSRGSIQVRGLSEASAPQFADAIAALEIAAEDGVPVLCCALAGLDATEIFDATSLARDLRQRLAQTMLAARLSPKVSVIIDGNGAIGLDAIAADIRLRAKRESGDIVLDISIGGRATHALGLGKIAPVHGVETVIRLLEEFARHGRETRARDVLAAEGAKASASAIGELSPSPIGTFPLHDETVAAGIGLTFGHADTTALERLVDAADASGASGLRTAPGRALLAIGLAPDRAPAFAARAENLGFITQADDARRRVIACAGAPICASARIASRALAPAIAADVGEHFAGTIHVSGCSKGCAHASRAALTVVGTAGGCAMIANGSVRDAPFAVVPEGELRVAVKNHVRESKKEAAHV